MGLIVLICARTNGFSLIFKGNSKNWLLTHTISITQSVLIGVRKFSVIIIKTDGREKGNWSHGEKVKMNLFEKVKKRVPTALNGLVKNELNETSCCILVKLERMLVFSVSCLYIDTVDWLNKTVWFQRVIGCSCRWKNT